MSASDAYYQFPLSALAYGPDPITRLRHIVDHCIVTVGRGEAHKMTMAELKAEVAKMPTAHQPGHVRLSDRDDLALCKGMMMLRVSGGGIQKMIRQHDSLAEFCADMAAKHGASPLVRVRHDLMWDCINGGMQYRLFSVLCAVYCQVGSDSYRRVTRDQLIAGQLGYKSIRLLTPETLAARKDSAVPLTTDQMRYTLDQLEQKSLFARVNLSARRTYFSHRLSREEMWAKLEPWRIAQLTKLAKNRQADRELQQRVKDACIAVGKRPARSPHRPRTVPAQPPIIPHTVPTTTESSPEKLFNEPISKEASAYLPAARACVPVSSDSGKDERSRLQRLIKHAEQIGTAEALKQAAQFKSQLAGIGAAS